MTNRTTILSLLILLSACTTIETVYVSPDGAVMDDGGVLDPDGAVAEDSTVPRLDAGDGCLPLVGELGYIANPEPGLEVGSVDPLDLCITKDSLTLDFTVRYQTYFYSVHSVNISNIRWDQCASGTYLFSHSNDVETGCGLLANTDYAFGSTNDPIGPHPTWNVQVTIEKLVDDVVFTVEPLGGDLHVAIRFQVALP